MTKQPRLSGLLLVVWAVLATDTTCRGQQPSPTDGKESFAGRADGAIRCHEGSRSRRNGQVRRDKPAGRVFGD